MTSLWLGLPSPELGTGAAVWFSGLIAWFVPIAALASVLFAAFRMATSGTFEAGRDLGGSLMRLVLVTGLVAFMTTTGLQMGNMLADWLVKTTPAPRSFVLGSLVATNPGLVLLLAIVVLLAQIIQFVLMLIKNAMIVALVAFLPLTAAVSNMPTGRQGYAKALGWLAAFVAYKPLAAAIYVLSWRLSGNENTLTGQMSGIALMLVAIFALPTMIKFLVPAAAAATGGNAGALAGATVGAALATGAVIATGGAAAGAGGLAAGGGGAASSGPSGASVVSGAIPPSPSGTAGQTSQEAMTND